LKFVIGLALLGLPAGGCGGETSGTIVGKVAFRGQPVPGGFVDFVSEGGKVTTGRIQPDGTYTVSGVPVGRAAITVRDLSGGLGGAAGTKPLKLPLRYRSAEASGLHYTVNSGRQQHNLDLSE
jgi:hypothetical protein